MSDHECHPGLRNSSWGQSGLLGGIRVYAGAAEARGNWVPHVCVPVPQESRLSPRRPRAQGGHSPVVWIHDGNEEDIDSIPLIKSDLVVCWTSQDVIRDIWPLQGNAVVGVMAAHVVLGKGQVCSQAVGLGGPQGWAGTSGLRRRRRRELCALRWLCECRLCLKTTRKTDVTNKIDDRTHATHGGVKKKGAPRPQAGPGPGRGRAPPGGGSAASRPRIEGPGRRETVHREASGGCFLWLTNALSRQPRTSQGT